MIYPRYRLRRFYKDAWTVQIKRHWFSMWATVGGSYVSQAQGTDIIRAAQRADDEKAHEDALRRYGSREFINFDRTKRMQ